MRLQGRIMSEKRFYWIKLKTDFFNLPEIDWLLSQKNGAEYIVLYQMLCLMTANNNGELSSKFGEMIIPYDVDKIVRDTKYFDFDTVKVALELYKKLGLVYESENDMLRISKYEEMIGSESKWAIKKREYRQRKDIEQNNKKLLGQKEDIVRQEIDIEKEIEIDKDIYKKENKKKKETLSSVINEYTDNEELRECLKEFVEMRKAGQKGMFTVSALKRNLTKLDTLAVNDGAKIDIVNQSIEYTYKGFYPLKEETRTIQNGVLPF